MGVESTIVVVAAETYNTSNLNPISYRKSLISKRMVYFHIVLIIVITKNLTVITHV